MKNYFLMVFESQDDFCLISQALDVLYDNCEFLNYHVKKLAIIESQDPIENQNKIINSFNSVGYDVSVTNLLLWEPISRGEFELEEQQYELCGNLHRDCDGQLRDKFFEELITIIENHEAKIIGGYNPETDPEFNYALEATNSDVLSFGRLLCEIYDLMTEYNVDYRVVKYI